MNIKDLYKQVRENDRKEQIRKRVQASITKYSPSVKEKALIAERIDLCAKKFSKLIMECFKAESRLERKWMWSEVKQLMVKYNFNISFTKISRMLRLYKNNSKERKII